MGSVLSAKETSDSILSNAEIILNAVTEVSNIVVIFERAKFYIPSCKPHDCCCTHRPSFFVPSFSHHRLSYVYVVRI